MCVCFLEDLTLTYIVRAQCVVDVIVTAITIVFIVVIIIISPD